MNKRERVLTALEHKEPDRVPIGEYSLFCPRELMTKVSGYDITAFSRMLIRNSNLFEKIYPSWRSWLDNYSILLPPTYMIHCARVLEKMGADLFFLTFSGTSILEKLSPISLIDTSGWKWEFRESDGGLEMIYTGGIVKTEEDLEKVKAALDPNNPIFLQWLEDMKKELKDIDIYPIGTTVNGIFESTLGCMEHRESLVSLYRNRSFFVKVLDTMEKVCLERIKILLDAGFEVICYSDDLAHDKGPFLNQKLMNELIFPRIKKVVDLARRRGGIVGLHSCGDIWKLLDRLSEMFDFIHPIQSTVMNIAEVKKKYGDRISLMGNIDSHYLLPFGTPEEVAKKTKETIKAAAIGGGYICCSDHSWNYRVKYENAAAMIEAAKKYGKYPISISD